MMNGRSGSLDPALRICPLFLNPLFVNVVISGAVINQMVVKDERATRGPENPFFNLIVYILINSLLLLFLICCINRIILFTKSLAS